MGERIPVAVIPGDGIGREVTPYGVQALELAAQIHGGFSFQFQEFPWSCEYYQQTGRMMPDDGIATLRSFEAIFLGAVGLPQVVPDHVSLWGLLIPIRRELHQYINLRPVKYLAGIKSPLANPDGIDILVVRENSEGEYSPSGGRIGEGEDELVIQNAVFTRKGTERAMRYAFQLAAARLSSRFSSGLSSRSQDSVFEAPSSGKPFVTSATKSNGIFHSMPFWDDVFEDVAKDYPKVGHGSMHIDALAAAFVTKPQSLDVVVASNLFGDILTDVGAAIMGSIGIAPSANLNPSRKYPSMFEPVHGSAPDIVGKGIANPIGQLWSAKMMLDFFGYEEVAQLLMESIELVIQRQIVTPDLGGRASTKEAAEAVLSTFQNLGNRGK